MTVLRVAFALEGHRDYQVIPALTERVLQAEYPGLQLAVAPRPGRKRGFGFISELGHVLKALADEGVPLCVAVVDANGEESRRLRDLRDAADRAQPIPVVPALAVAVRTLEAWLLADERAIGAALAGSPPVERQSEPRSIKDPKAALQRIIEEHTDGAEFYTHAIGRAIARQADLSVLRRRCSDFDGFCSELTNALRQCQRQGIVP